MLMEDHSARLILLIDTTKKQVFDEICAICDLTPSQVVHQMIRDYVQQYRVQQYRVQQYGILEQISRMPFNNKVSDR